MKIKSRLLATDLPFHPTLFVDPLSEVCLKQINSGAEPAVSISYTIRHLLDSHIILNLEPNLEILNQKYKTTSLNLKMLRLGYNYAVDTVIISALCKNVPESERINLVNKLFQPSLDPLVNTIQGCVRKNLRASVNLFNLDPTAAFVFQDLEKYPYTHDPYFVAGIEASSIVFFGLIDHITELLPKEKQGWITQWQGVPMFA